MNEMDETLQIFFQETEDLLKAAEEALLRLEGDPKTGPHVEELFRSIHTLKSGSAMVGFTTTSEYAHALENLLERVRGGTLPISKPLVSYLLEDVDFLRQMVENGAEGRPEAEPGVIKNKKAQVNRFLGMDAIPGAEPEEERPRPAQEPKPPAAAPVAAPGPEKTREPEPLRAEPEKDDSRFFEITLRFKNDLFLSGQDPILLLLALSEMAELVDVAPDLSRLPRYDELDPFSMYLSWRIVAKTQATLEEIGDIFLFVKDDNPIEIEEVSRRFKDGVDVEVGEQPIGEVLVSRGAVSREDLGGALREQKKIGQILVESGKVEEAVLDEVVSQQNESRVTYRKTSLRVDVEKIEHLMNLAEEIGIGLSRTRNVLERMEMALDHELSIELENLHKVNREFQERVAQVRMFPLEGTFRRFQRIARDTAFEQGKRIRVLLSGVDTELDKEVIEHITDPLKHLVRNCVDHGIEPPAERESAGKNPEGVIGFRAFQKGGMILVQIRDDGRGVDYDKVLRRALEKGVLKQGETVGPENVLDILCTPGFSTAQEVTALSGRGVGMDVVRTEVEKLGGAMALTTEKGKGSTFTLSLPLTFALTEVLHVLAHGRSFLVPLWGVAGTEEYNPGRVRFFGGTGRVALFRDEYVPLVSLGSLFGLDAEGGGQGTVLVFIDTARQRFGLLVDEVQDPHQVVVKSLETNFRGVPGISGATLMGDGSISLVIDLFSVEEMFFRPVGGRHNA
jgi:two-component system chemotaxis sensor kinase CheA